MARVSKNTAPSPRVTRPAQAPPTVRAWSNASRDTPGSRSAAAGGWERGKGPACAALSRPAGASKKRNVPSTPPLPPLATPPRRVHAPAVCCGRERVRCKKGGRGVKRGPALANFVSFFCCAREKKKGPNDAGAVGPNPRSFAPRFFSSSRFPCADETRAHKTHPKQQVSFLPAKGTERERLPLCHLLHFSHPLLNSSARDHVRRRGPGQATSSCASCDMDQAGKKDAQKEKTSAASKAQHKKQGRALSCRSGHHLQRGSLSNQDTHPHAPCAPPLAREAAKPNACPHAFCGS